ncbi:MAG: two-component sensor histidine kinase [Gemmataceae bacterium]|nr:two-component sensor histidine kinase [Gemmataceae bacterium]
MSDAALADPPEVRHEPGADAPRPPDPTGGLTPPARQEEASSARPESSAGGDDLGELAGGFIHDLKNHLGTLSLNLQLLAEDFESPQTPRERKALDRVNRLHAECQKLADLANDFLRFARAQNPDLRPAALGDVVDRLIEFLAPTARQAGIEVQWFPAPGLPPVRLDRDLFEQALLNLMLNAEQAMPDGGTLTLVGRADADGWVSLDVIDTGDGMGPEVLAKAFRPFHTTKKGGHGLGLATARRVVEAHGGSIDCQSEPGRGTKFTIRLPAAGS